MPRKFLPLTNKHYGITTNYIGTYPYMKGTWDKSCIDSGELIPQSSPKRT